MTPDEVHIILENINWYYDYSRKNSYAMLYELKNFTIMTEEIEVKFIFNNGLYYILSNYKPYHDIKHIIDVIKDAPLNVLATYNQLICNACYNCDLTRLNEIISYLHVDFYYFKVKSKTFDNLATGIIASDKRDYDLLIECGVPIVLFIYRNGFKLTSVTIYTENGKVVLESIANDKKICYCDEQYKQFELMRII